MLQVYHLAKFYPPAPGGIESHLRTISTAQARLGAHVEVLCVNHRDCDGRDITWKTFARTPSVDEWDGSVRLTRLGRYASLARLDVCPELPALLRRLPARRGAVLHLHVPNPTMLLALAWARPRLPVVITYHSDIVRQRYLAQALRPFESAVFRKARVILATSPNYLAGSATLQSYRSKVQVLPFGIPLGPYREPSREALDFAARYRREWGKPLWLAVGRLVYYKGLHTAFEALRDVPGTLVIVGDGPLRGELEERARCLGVAERVVWAGRLGDTELVGAYHAATALWFPSNARSEAFGLVQVEAMASGCPVINTDIPGSGVAWVSRHDESGLTVPMDDPEALARAANRLVMDDGLRARLSEGARRRAESSFSDDLMARRTLDVYRQVVAEPSRRLAFA